MVTADAHAAVQSVLRHPDWLYPVVQPIVDLQAGQVAGWEVLARIPEHLGVSPDRLFAAAEELGLSVPLNVLALERALPLRADLPANTFMTVNVSPGVLPDARVMELFAAAGDLHRIFVELGESTYSVDIRSLIEAINTLRSCGAMIALDDIGAGDAGLRRMLQLRPDLVKLDRELIGGLDTDPGAQATVVAVGAIAATMDAWVAVEGLQTRDELAAAMRLDVPLGQGFLFGAPARPWPRVDTAVVVEQTRFHRLDEMVVSLMLRPPEPRVVVDGFGRPRLVEFPAPDGSVSLHPAMTIAPATPIPEALRRALSRPQSDRFVPLVVTSADGLVMGIVRVEDLALSLAGSPVPSDVEVPGPFPAQKA